MEKDDILLVLILAILALFVYRGCVRSGVDPRSAETGSAESAATAATVAPEESEESYENMGRVEHMAPLNFGTFEDNYPRGECRTGEYWKRKPCEVGNCPLSTTVSDQQFCRIQCAQDPDPLERQDCYDNCIANLC